MGDFAAIPGNRAEPAGLVQVSVVGNTTGASASSRPRRALSFNAAGAVSMGFSNSSLYVSAPVQTNQTGISGLMVSNTTYTSGTVSFSNANGISFGSSAGQAVTASYTVPATAGLISGLNVSGGAGNSQSNVSGITFSNSNGLTFGVSTGASVVTVTGSYTVPTQTNQSLGIYGSSQTVGQSSSSTYDARSLSIVGSGDVSVGWSNSSLLIQAPVQSVGVSTGGNTLGNTGTYSGQVVFVGSNNITLSVGTAAGGAQTITISGPTVGGAQTGISSVAASGGTQTVGMVSFINSNNITFGMSTGANTGSLTASYALNVSAGGGTSNALSAITFTNSNGVTFGLSTGAGVGTMTASVAAQSNQTLGFYAVGNTASTSTSTTLDARTISFNAAGALSVGFSNGSINLSAPATSSLSATGAFSISSNGSTISMGVIPSSLYALGNTFGTSSGTADERTYSVSGVSGIAVAASNSGFAFANVAQSMYEPFPILTGTAFSSHAPASWWFNKFTLADPIAISNINVVKSFNAAVPTDTLASSGICKISYSHGVTIFTRQDYVANSSNLSTLTTASAGFTASISYTSISQSVAYSWVTNTAGGTTSFSTTSSNGNWSSYFTGAMIFPIPCLTTLTEGEYFIAHAHSTTTGTTGNSNFTLMSFSNLHIAPPVINVGVLGSSGSQASLNPWGAGVGIASAVTTTSTMAGSVISGNTVNNWYAAFSNA